MFHKAKINRQLQNNTKKTKGKEELTTTNEMNYKEMLVPYQSYIILYPALFFYNPWRGAVAQL